MKTRLPVRATLGGFDNLTPLVQAEQARQQASATPQQTGNSWGISTYDIDLASIQRANYTVDDGRTFPIGNAGQKIQVMRSFSHPGARVNLDIGGDLTEISPGTIIEVPFSKAIVRASVNSIRYGNVRLAVFSDARQKIIEPKEIPRMPAVMLGPGGGADPVAVTVTENTVPDFTASWDVTGWRKLRVFTVGGGTAGTAGGAIGGATTMSSATIIPWFTTAAIGGPTSAITAILNGRIIENGLGTLSLPDSAATGYPYRVFSIELEPWLPIIESAKQNNANIFAGVNMAFEVRDLLPAGATTVDFYVFGVE